MWNACTSVMRIAIVVLIIILAGAKLGGIKTFIVLSGSMEPIYHVGSLIYVKSVDEQQLEAGDIITYELGNDAVATHRIEEVIIDEMGTSKRTYRTKGDANEAVDGGIVEVRNIIGTPIFTIPKLGYLLRYFNTSYGMYATIFIGVFMIFLMYLPDVKNIKKKEEL